MGWLFQETHTYVNEEALVLQNLARRAQHSRWCCIAQQIFTEGSFQLFKGVSLLHLRRLGMGQDVSDIEEHGCF